MIHFREIAAHYGIGMLLSAPSPVLGGLLHTTYRLDTAEGSYAAKILNPAVMQRPEALGNMIRSERIARAMADAVPAVAAIESEGSPVSKIGEDYVMLYPWLSCRPVLPPKLSARHTEIVGKNLARIHVAGEALLASGIIPAEADAPGSPQPRREWGSLLADASAASPDAPWLPQLRDALPLLDELEEKAVKASPRLPRTVLSHRDLDPKNVLWEGAAPRIIDWESAGEVNPGLELAETLLYWSDDGAGGLNESLFRPMLTAYRSVRTAEEWDWDAVFDASFLDPLDWLAYNVRRASGLEAADDSHERMVGASEVSGTLRSLPARIPQLKTVRDWMGV